MGQSKDNPDLSSHVQHINPDALIKNPAFTNVIVVTGAVKTVYIGGQDAVDASGETARTHPPLRACLYQDWRTPTSCAKWAPLRLCRIERSQEWDYERPFNPLA